MTIIRIIGKNGQLLIGKTVLDPTEKEIKSLASTGIIPEKINIIRSTK